MATKTVRYNKSGTSKLPDNKPVIYKILTDSDKNNYTGIAKKGRVQERINEHLKDNIIPGSKIKIEQVSSIEEAAKREQNIIARTKPKYNEKGK
jgi:hypothetical protein